MKKPPLFTENESRLNHRFFFVSYSHKDHQIVYRTLNRLYESNVNFWYDNDLNVGDVWNEKVKDILQNEDCVGAFVFLSKHSIKSLPVNHEVEIMLNTQKSRPFVIAPIVIPCDIPEKLTEISKDTMTVNDLINIVASNDPSFSTKSRRRDYYINDIACDDLSISTSNALLLEKLLSTSNNADIKSTHTINVNRTSLIKLPHIHRNGCEYYCLGQYPIDLSGTQKNIYWIPICKNNNFICLIANSCLDFVGCDAITATLEHIRSSFKEYTDFICNISLPSESFFEEYYDKIPPSYPTEYADDQRRQLLRVHWVKDGEGASDQLVLYTVFNKKVGENINHENINAGIRPIIVIDSNKIQI